jgi:hypothetical protein
MLDVKVQTKNNSADRRLFLFRKISFSRRTQVDLKNAAFWDVPPYRFVEIYRSFGGIYTVVFSG